MSNEAEIENCMTLMSVYEKKKAELAVVGDELEEFKKALFFKLEDAGLESVKKDGYSFTIVRPHKSVVDEDKAIAEITEKGKKLIDFMSFDKKKFEMFDPMSSAITSKAIKCYLKITPPKKEKK